MDNQYVPEPEQLQHAAKKIAHNSDSELRNFAMAYPDFVVEQAVRQFMKQWCSGLRQLLSLKTLENGAINLRF